MKKMKFKKTLLITLFLISNATQNNTIQNDYEKNNIESNLCPNLDEENVETINGEHSFNNGYEYFDYLSNFKVDKIIYEGNAKLSNYSISDNNIRCFITDIDDLDEIILSFIRDDEVIDRKALYFAKSNEGVYFSSSFAMDDAKVAAGKTLNYSLYYEDKNKNVNDIPAIDPTSVGVDGSVSGTLKWTDEQGNIHPLVEAKVKVTINGSWWSAETYTDNNGYYNIGYENIWYVGSGKPTVHIYTENQSIKVHNGGTYEHSYEFSGSSGYWTYDYTFSSEQDERCGEAMMIFQGAKYYADYAKYLNGGKNIEICNFHYPNNEVGYADYNNGTVRICEDIPKNNLLPKPYASWDVIGHEYAHHLQNIFKFNDNPGGHHYIDTNNIDNQHMDDEGKIIKPLAQAKDDGHKLSWCEGWATYWSIVAQSYFNNDLKTINTVGDTSYTGTNDVDVDINLYDSNSKGDASELAIARFLYKLYSLDNDYYDKFALGDLKIWNIVVKNRPVNFSKFINNLYDEGLNKDNLALLLGKYNVISNSIRSSNNNLTYSWSTYMGSKYLRFDKYDLFFEDMNGNILIEKNDIVTSSNLCEVTLSKSEWDIIKNNSSSEFIVYYIAWQNTGTLSGGYYSKKITKYI